MLELGVEPGLVLFFFGLIFEGACWIFCGSFGELASDGCGDINLFQLRELERIYKNVSQLIGEILLGADRGLAPLIMLKQLARLQRNRRGYAARCPAQPVTLLKMCVNNLVDASKAHAALPKV